MVAFHITPNDKDQDFSFHLGLSGIHHHHVILSNVD
jgi:hypothetical protein